MRRLIVLGAAALRVLVTVPIASAATTSVTTKHVDGTIVASESGGAWIARFEVRTTSGVVQFGYLELYGIDGSKSGQIIQFPVDRVEYFKTASGAQGARLYMHECHFVPYAPCWDGDVYDLTDGSAVGQEDTILASLGWIVESGNISIYTTNGQNSQ